LTLTIDWDEGAIKQILRDGAIETYMLGIGDSIASSIERDSGDHRSGDNSPRHVKGTAKALHPGRGYEHYQDAIEVVRGMDKGMSAVYVFGTRHSMTQEYGWTNWVTGISYPGRYYMTLALLEHEVK
jgi:hypothetical protein